MDADLRCARRRRSAVHKQGGLLWGLPGSRLPRRCGATWTRPHVRGRSSPPRGPERALEVYRRRGTVEKSFDDLKNHLDMRRMRTHSDAAADGRMFCAFVGLVARARM